MVEVTGYFGKSFEIPYIERGASIPVGGTNILTDETNVRVLVDWNGLESLVQEMKAVAQKYDRPKLKEWLKSSKIEVNEDLFAMLHAFTDVYKERIGFEQDSNKRRELYCGDSPRLSEVIRGNAAECAEITALAQLYLQEEIDSTYFAGEVLWNKDREFAEAHSFIPLIFDGQEYIFDPANPHKVPTKGGEKMLIPRIQKVEGFRDKINQGKKTYVEATSVLNQTSAWYGVGDGTNVSERDFN